MQSKQSITTHELRSIAVLAGIAALRMLGLCLILPIFAVAAPNYTAATAKNIGIAIGIYGLLQAALQIPYGVISDRLGRKPLIFLGLTCIFLGSITCANAHSIYTIIFGRALQGAGAIGSVVMATVVDSTREQVRSRALAMVGASMGLAFALALVLSPWLYQAFGLVAIFGLTAALALCGMVLLPLIPSSVPSSSCVPLPVHPNTSSRIDLNTSSRSSQPQAGEVAGISKLNLLTNKNQTWPLYAGAFILHANMAALFLVLPILLRQALDQNIWLVYAGTLSVAMLVAWQALKIAELKHNLAQLQLFAIAVLAGASLCLGFAQSWQGFFVYLMLYFSAFCLLEASMPSLIAKYAVPSRRGAALGVYATLQFLGVCVGGMLGGWLHGDFGILAVIGFSVSLTIIWLVLAILVNQRKVSWQEV